MARQCGMPEGFRGFRGIVRVGAGWRWWWRWSSGPPGVGETLAYCGFGAALPELPEFRVVVEIVSLAGRRRWLVELLYHILAGMGRGCQGETVRAWR